MKKAIFQASTFSILLSFTLLFSSSCKKNQDDPQEIANNDTCTFVQNNDDMDGLIDDAESDLLITCNENKLTSKSGIETNLIGEWELIGHGEGWIPTTSQPCSSITITEDELVLEFTNSYLDTLTNHTWEINEAGNGNFSLQLTPNDMVGLFINVFCNDYMYGHATPFDGNMYLYQKVN